MVKPGGTGRPAFVISASPAPLPPRTSFILPLPSALPPPNEYTYFVLAGFVAAGFVSVMRVSGRVVVAIGSLSLIFRRYFVVVVFVDSLPSVTISEKSAIV